MHTVKFFVLTAGYSFLFASENCATYKSDILICGSHPFYCISTMTLETSTLVALQLLSEVEIIYVLMNLQVHPLTFICFS